MALDSYESVRMPFPGRRTRKLERTVLVCGLSLLILLGTFSHLLPGVLGLTQEGGDIELGQSAYGIPPPLPDGPRSSLPPGTIQYGSRATPIQAQVSDSSIQPYVASTSEAYVYQTSFGQYSFNRSSPFAFALSSKSGVPLTSGSLFFVAAATSPVQLAPGNSNVTVASDNRFEVQYEVLLGNVTVGVMLFRADFHATTRPKFTAEFSQSPTWNFGSFNIVWSTITIPQWVRTTVPGQNQSSAVNIDGLSSSALAAASRVEVGPSADTFVWRDWITMDWSDAPGGVLEAGPLGVNSLSGLALNVIFPDNERIIDPSQVATSPIDWSTAYSTQRKTFSYGSYYFLFWYDGANIVYSSSPNGINWSSAFSTGSGLAGWGFDVYNQNSTVALAWLKYDPASIGDRVTQLLFRKGTIFGSSILWNSNSLVASLSQPYSNPPSVAIASDGSFWAGGIWYPSSGGYNVWIYRSSDGVSFSLKTNYQTHSSGSRIEALQLIPLPQGRIMSLTAHWSYSTIRWLVYNPVTDSWTQIKTFEMYLPTSTPKWDLVSATSTPDGFVHLVWRKYCTICNPVNSISYQPYDPSSDNWTFDGYEFLYSGIARYPSISSDNQRNLYVFWMEEPAGTPTNLLYRMKPKSAHGWGDTNWSSPTSPFGSGSLVYNGRWLSAARSASKQVLVARTIGGPSPNKIVAGSIPIPSGVASAPPSEPWNRLGLSSTAPVGEYVSPGNGLLGISQTDISVPGRNGLSLSISRMYIQPFTFLQGNPFNFETSPYPFIGNGWQLNLPWVGTQYLHYFNGQVFPILWTSYTTTTSGAHIIYTWSFENHGSEDFVFSYTEDEDHSGGDFVILDSSFKLTTKDGTVFNFDHVGSYPGVGILRNIVDATGQNSIIFNYACCQPVPRLSSVTDTVGRTASFNYDANSRLASVTFGGRTVSYGYSGNNLSTVTDPVGRTLTFRYSPLNNWLISGVIYPTGGNSTYTYGSATIGTDVVNYYVTLQNLYAGALVRSTSFSPQVTDGAITYNEIAQSDGGPVQGYTVHEFNARSKSSTVTILDPSRVEMRTTQAWYDDTGRVVQEDVYSGNTTSRTLYTSLSYDNWGNIIYAKDAVGHESYSSYANTNTQYSFQGPGNLALTTDGKKFYDDFNRASLDAGTWIQGGSAVGRAASTVFSLLNLTGTSTSQGTWKSSWVRSSGTFGYPFYAEVQMALNANPGQTTLDVDFQLSPQATASNGDPYLNPDLLRLIVNDGVNTGPAYVIVKCISGSCSTIYNSVASGRSLSVSWKIILTDSNTLTVYLNKGSGYELIFSTTTLGLSSSFAPSYAYLAMYNLNTLSYSATFDYVGLSGSNSITISGLQAEQKVELYDSNDVLQKSGIVAAGQSTLSLDATKMVFPYGYLRIYDLDGRTVQFTSPTREVWGGSTYTYTPPFKSGGLTRTNTGFLKSSNVYVDDYLPSGAVTYTAGGDVWRWTYSSSFPSVSGFYSHIGLPLPGSHQHWFQGASTTISPTTGQFHIQYVFIPSGTIPSAIMLQFHEPSGSWQHRAYWGSNLLCSPGATGSPCQSMGPIPASRDQWVMLIVKADDVSTNGRVIDGLAYTLYDGGVFWDFSAVGAASTGTVTVNNLLAGQKVELYDAGMVLKATGTVAAGSSLVTLDVYGAGINVFPFKGYLKVYTATGSLQYLSPLMADIWGGDVYSYNQPVFSNSFSFSTIPTTVHSRIVGSTQFQNAGAVPQESYSKYDAVGNLVEQRQMHNGSPLTTTYTYDAYGNPTTLVDTNGNTIRYSYSSAYNYAYLTNEDRTVFSSIFSDQFDQTLSQWTTESGTWALENGELSGSGTSARIISAQTFPSDRTFQIRMKAITAGPDSWYAPWVSGKYVDGGNNALVVLHTTGLLEFSVAQGGSTNSYTTQTSLNVYAWHTAKMVFTGNNVKVYMDNTLYLDLTDAKIGALGTSKIRLASWGPTNSHFDDARVETEDSVSTIYGYDLNTGNLLSLTDPMGNVASYQYDAVGRTTLVTFPPVNGVTANVLTEYQDSQNAVAARNEKGNYTRQVYDGLGRTITIEQYSGDLSSAILSVERYTYDWQGKVKTYMAPDGNITRYDYDYLGRLVKVTNPDNTYRTTSYDDLSFVESRFDENQHRTDYVYDKLQRLVEVREYYSASSYYSTSYSYDEVGNLLDKVASNQQVLSFSPTDDAFIQQGTPTTNYGSDSRLKVDNSPVQQYLLKFTVSGVGSSQVKSAKLRLFDVDSSPKGGDFYRTASSNWFEGNVTWNNAPATSGSMIASLGTVSLNNWYTVDITSAVAGDGTVSLRVTSTNSDGADYYSKEGLSWFAPQLLVTISSRQTTTYSYDDLNRLVLTTYPDGFNETLTYDNIGNLVSKKNPNGNTITYDYDGLNRPTTITYPDSSIASFSYDKNSNMIGASNPNAFVTFKYDSLNRLTDETWTISGSAYPLSYRYDAVGNLVGITYPDAKSVSYSVDPLDRVTSVRTGATNLATISYASNGAIRTISYGNGVQTSYTYDNQARPSRIKIARGSTTLLDLNYGYDPAGNIITITGTNSETYSYDYLNRLTYSSGPWGTLRYGYDSAGNRLWMKQGTTNTTYTYGPYNRLVGVGTAGYGYDGNGNLKVKTSGATATNYYYDFENRLTKVTQGTSTLGTYAYSAMGDRIKSVESGTTTAYLNSGFDTLYEKKSTSSTTTINDYVYVGNNLLAKLSGTSMYFFHQDHLGSTRLVTLGTTTSFSTNYQPFGPQYGTTGTDPGYKYTGKPSSSAIGLSYYGARWYNPSIGRFASRDPVPGSLSDPQTLNPYAYVANNPLRYTDPTGAVINLLAAGIGALVGGVVGYVGCGITTGGWSTSGCVTAGLVGAAVGGLAGLTFGASLAFAGGTLGLGTATASGGFVFSGVSGLTAFAFAGAISGAIAGGSEYILSGVSGLSGGDWQFSAQELGEQMVLGLALGAATSAGGYTIGKLAGRLITAATMGPGKLPMQNAPGIVRGVDNSGLLTKIGIYDKSGNLSSHIDVFGPSHGGIPTPHAHLYSWTQTGINVPGLTGGWAYAKVVVTQPSSWEKLLIFMLS